METKPEPLIHRPDLVRQDRPLELPPSIKPSSGEELVDAVAALVGLVPVLGGVVSAALTGATGQRRHQRIADALQSLHADLRDLKDQIREEYVRSEEFEELFVQTLERISKELDVGKREMYRAYLRNILVETPRPYREHRMMLRFADEFLPEHVAVLDAFSATPALEMQGMSMVAPIHVIGRRLLPNFDLDVPTIKRLVSDLERDGLLSDASGSLSVSMSGGSAENLVGRVTQRGQTFRRFLKS